MVVSFGSSMMQERAKRVDGRWVCPDGWSLHVVASQGRKAEEGLCNKFAPLYVSPPTTPPATFQPPGSAPPPQTPPSTLTPGEKRSWLLSAGGLAGAGALLWMLVRAAK